MVDTLLRNVRVVTPIANGVPAWTELTDGTDSASENIRVSAENRARRRARFAVRDVPSRHTNGSEPNNSVRCRCEGAHGEAARSEGTSLLDHVGAARRRLEGNRD